MKSFKELHSPRSRSLEYKKIYQKHPDRFPIIVEKDERCQLPDIPKNKFLVSNDITMGQFIYIIRKRVDLGPEQSLFVMVNGALVNSSTPLSKVYEDQQDEDGFLYMVYTSENTFG